MRILATLSYFPPSVMLALACSSGGANGETGQGDSGMKGVLAPDSSSSGAPNPYGVPYPTANLGVTGRNGSSTPGNVIQNFTFLGYANPTPGTPTTDKGTVTQISLADFYDPANKKYKVLHISVAATWCKYCNQEAQAVTASGVVAGLAKDDAVILSALTEGETQGTGATLSDLQAWIRTWTVDYDMVLDPEGMNLGIFFPESALPFNADIDVRTMEILDGAVGYDGMTAKDIESQVTWVENNPPSYGCPTGYKLKKYSCVETD
jgi:hypothetical protein